MTMKTFKITLALSAECKADAQELINDYTGKETYVTILNIEAVD